MTSISCVEGLVGAMEGVGDFLAPSTSCSGLSSSLTDVRLGAVLLRGDKSVEAPTDGTSDSRLDSEANRDASRSSSTYVERLTEAAI